MGMEQLQEIEAVKAENDRWNHEKKVSAEIYLIGKRPAGTQSAKCKIVRAAWEADLALAIDPEFRPKSSTDANLQISLGIPAIAVGRGGKEGGVHTLKEWFEPVDAFLGPQRDLLLILALSGCRGYREYQLEKR